jgi:transcription elongation factor Elf1
MEISRFTTSSSLSGKVGCIECGARETVAVETRLTKIKFKDGFALLLCNKCERKMVRKILESYGAI